MNGLSATRLAVYALGLAAGAGATWAAAQGLVTYDPQTGTLDVLPFNVNAAVASAVSAAANLLAGIALWRGWGK